MQEGGAQRKPLILEYGELTRLSQDTGRSVSHLSRFLRGERPSKELEALVLERYGRPVGEIEVARRRHKLAEAGA